MQKCFTCTFGQEFNLINNETFKPFGDNMTQEQIRAGAMEHRKFNVGELDFDEDTTISSYAKVFYFIEHF